MSFRSGLLALGSGAALGLATAVALGVGAFEEEAAIVVRPVELVDPAPEDPFDLDPFFAPGHGAATSVGAGTGLSADDREAARDASAAGDAAREHPVDDRSDSPSERTIELAGGDFVTIRTLDAPALRLVAEDVAFVELAESALGEDGRIEGEVDPDEAGGADREEGTDDTSAAVPDVRFAVYAVLSESGRAAWTPYAAEHANAWLLVEIEGRPIDLVRPLGWSRGLRIGVFADELARSRYVAALELDAR